MISAKKNSISAADNPKRIVVVLPKDRAMEIAEKSKESGDYSKIAFSEYDQLLWDEI